MASVAGKLGVPDESVIGDVKAAQDYVKAQPYSTGKVGIIGTCSGGRHAYLVAATLKSFDLIARQVMPRFAAGNDRRTKSYHWMGEHVEAFTKAREEAMVLAIQKHEADVAKAEAEVVLSAILREINSGTAQVTRPVYTFEQFVKDVYLPFCRRASRHGRPTCLAASSGWH